MYLFVILCVCRYIFVCAIFDENSDEKESVNVCHVPQCAQTQAMDIQLSAKRTEFKKGGCTGILDSSSGSCSLWLI